MHPIGDPDFFMPVKVAVWEVLSFTEKGKDLLGKTSPRG